MCHVDTCARPVAVVSVMPDLCALHGQVIFLDKLRTVGVACRDEICLIRIQANGTVIQVCPRLTGIVFRPSRRLISVNGERNLPALDGIACFDVVDFCACVLCGIYEFL